METTGYPRKGHGRPGRRHKRGSLAKPERQAVMKPSWRQAALGAMGRRLDKEEKAAHRNQRSTQVSYDPANELVDEIDEAGNTVGVVRRAEMRGRRLPHRCVYLLVFNRRGELFIHLRTPTKDVYPSHWDVAVGGVLAAGETFAQGVGREMEEEIGVRAAVEELFPFRYEDERTIVHGMVYRAVHDGPFTLQPEEVVRGEFVEVAEVFRRAEAAPFCPDGLAALRRHVQT